MIALFLILTPPPSSPHRRHFGQVHLVTALKEVVLEFIDESSQSISQFEMNPEVVYKLIAGKNYNNTKTKEEIVKMPEVMEQLVISTIFFAGPALCPSKTHRSQIISRPEETGRVLTEDPRLHWGQSLLNALWR